MGPLVGSTITNDLETCLSACRLNEDCLWFTYHESDDVCYMTTECEWIDETCQDCIYGQAQWPMLFCGSQGQNATVVLVEIGLDLFPVRFRYLHTRPPAVVFDFGFSCQSAQNTLDLRCKSEPAFALPGAADPSAWISGSFRKVWPV